ncbi:MAG TPA: hypothetical protein VNL18_15575 [Gemmatimonadales bacterium]|nr:hypothetical protein [Gemmatimonadales bacterium]
MTPRRGALSLTVIGLLAAALWIANAVENAGISRRAVLRTQGHSTDRRVALLVAATESLEGRVRQLGLQRAQDSVTVVRLRAQAAAASRRADSLAREIPDTAMSIPRPVHEAIVADLRQSAASWEAAWGIERRARDSLEALVRSYADTVVPALLRGMHEYRDQREAWRREAGRGLLGLGRVFGAVGLGVTCGVGTRGTDCVLGATVRF